MVDANIRNNSMDEEAEEPNDLSDEEGKEDMYEQEENWRNIVKSSLIEYRKERISLNAWTNIKCEKACKDNVSMMP